MYSCIDYYLLPFPYSCNDGKIPISLCCRLTHSYLILIMITIAWGYRKWSLSFLGAFICFNWYIEIAIFLYIAPDFFSDFFSLFHWLISFKNWNLRICLQNTGYLVDSSLLFDWNSSSVDEKIEAIISFTSLFGCFLCYLV